jgi:hypothetical protein
MNKLYLNEFDYYNGENDTIFNIIDIDVDKMLITLAVSYLGKTSIIDYDLKRDIDNDLYFEYGPEFNEIKVDDFDSVND